MSHSRSFRRSVSRGKGIVASTSAVTLLSAGLLMAGAPAASAVACVATPVDLTGGVYQVTLTASCEWTAPSGLTALEALLVGAGGGGGTGYAGGGGEVKVVSLDTTVATWTVSVGSAAAADADPGRDSVVAEGATTETAKGAYSDGGIGTSGNANAGFMTYYGASGGGAGAAATDANGGAGVIVGELVASGLFDTDTDCFGGGGATSSNDAGAQPSDPTTPVYGTATCGGGYLTGSTPPVPGDPTLNAVTANSGGGGGSADLSWISQVGSGDFFNNVYDGAGADGVVVFRYTANSSSPAVTVTPYPAAKTIKYGYATPRFKFKATVGAPPVAFAGTWTTAPVCAVQLPAPPILPATYDAVLPVGTYPVVCTGGVGSAGETVTYVDGTLTVAPAYAVKVTPKSATWTTGQTPPALGYTASGFKNYESFSSPDMTAPVCSVWTGQGGTGTPVTIDSTTPAGTYYNYCSGAVTSANYVSPVKYGYDGVVKVLAVVTPTITSIKPAYGYARGGTKVYIYGTGLVTGTTVDIGGVPCARVSVNSYFTKLTCYTGAHAVGVVDVVVTSPGGTASLVGGYRYK